MSATQSWFGPLGITSLARFGKTGPSWSLSVVATTPTGPHGKPILLHQSHDLLVIDDMALGTQLNSDTPVAVGRPLSADLLDAFDERRLEQLPLRLVIECRACEAHQTASFLDGEAGGPAMTDVVALLAWAAAREASFRNSFSSVSLPTSRSRAAMRASCACMMSAATMSSSKPPASYLATQMRIRLREIRWRLASPCRVSPARYSCAT